MKTLRKEEMYRINWMLGGVLALVSIWTGFNLSADAFYHVILATTGIVSGLIWPRWPEKLPRIFWTIVPLLLLLLVAWDAQRFGLIPALVRLNLMLLLLRCLAYRSRREDLQLLLLCLFLIIMAGVLTVSFVFVLQILVFTACAMVYLFTINLADSAGEPPTRREIWHGFHWGMFFRRIRVVWDWRLAALALGLFGTTVGVSALIFLAIPRIDLENPISFINLGTARSYTGFSESIRFGDVTNIQQDNRTALRVDPGKRTEIPQDPYWRMLVLDEYEDGRLRLSAGARRSIRRYDGYHEVSGPHWRRRLLQSEDEPADEWTFYLESGVSRFLPLAGVYSKLRFRERHHLHYFPPLAVMGLRQTNSSMLYYQVEDMDLSGRYADDTFMRTPSVEAHEPRDQAATYPETTLALPLTEDEIAYLRKVIERISGGEALNPYLFAERAIDYLQERHGYALQFRIPPGDEDIVIRWMKSGEPGHCELFAGAMILLSRTAGFPARAATGFRGGSWNSYENYFMVRNRDAHAWVEIHDGEGFWFRADATPAADGDDLYGNDDYWGGFVFTDSSLAAFLDSMRILWYRRIVSFDQRSQSDFYVSLREIGTAVAESIRSSLRSALEQIRSFVLKPWDVERTVKVLLVPVSVVALVWLFRGYGWTGLFSWSNSGTAQKNAIRRKAGRCLRRMRIREKNRDDLPDPEWKRVRKELQELRYGALTGTEDAERVFRNYRRITKRFNGFGQSVRRHPAGP